MNPIGQSLLPIKPATADSNTPVGADSEARDFGSSFDSFLQRRFDEPAEATPAAVVATPTEEPAEHADNLESPDYATQAEIQALFGVPPAPPALPAPTFTLDAEPAEIAPPQSKSGSSEVETPPTLTTSYESTPDARPFPTQQQAPRNAPAAPGPMPSPRRFDSTAPEPISRPPETQPTTEAQAPDEPAANRDVANVLGIFPPVKLPKAVDGEAVGQAVTPVAAHIDIRDANPSPARVGASETPGVIAPTGTTPETTDAPAASPAAPTSTTPAISSNQSSASLPAKVENTSVALPHVETTLPLEKVALHSPTEKLGGTTAAKPGSEMSAITPQIAQRPTESDSDGIERRDASPEAVPSAGTQTSRQAPLQAAPAQPQQHEREPSKRDESNAEQKQPAPAIGIPFASASSEATRTTFGEPLNAPIRTPDVQQVVTHTMQAVERLRVSGMERLEVAVKLDNGTDVTIQLRVENGQVTPLIRTESEPLRIALEQNWAQFTQRGGDREARISTPVFESPQTSSNMSDMNQQRDGRQQAFKEQVPEYFQMPPPRRNAQHHTPHPAAPANAPAERVRLYA